MFYIGTSGWHYDDWTGLFYPPEAKGYKELTYYSQFFNTVENNSSFYRIAGDSTYKTWYRMTPEKFKFSLKLNQDITHKNRLILTPEVKNKVSYILETTQTLKEKLGAIVIQLPANFSYDLKRLKLFLPYFKKEVEKQIYQFDVAIEFRNKYWFNEDVYALLKKYNIALTYGQSSRYPGMRQITADFIYIRMHGPKELFASKYSDGELNELAVYIKSSSQKAKRGYIYFNNDFHGYALENARTLKELIL